MMNHMVTLRDGVGRCSSYPKYILIMPAGATSSPAVRILCADWAWIISTFTCCTGAAVSSMKGIQISAGDRP